MKEGKFILELKVYFYKGSVKLGPRWLTWRMDTIHLWRMLLWTHLARSMPWSPMSSLMVARYIDDCIVLTIQEIHIINVQMMRIQRYDQCGEYIDGFDVQERLVIKRFNHFYFPFWKEKSYFIICKWFPQHWLIFKGWNIYIKRSLHQYWQQWWCDSTSLLQQCSLRYFCLSCCEGKIIVSFHQRSEEKFT